MSDQYNSLKPKKVNSLQALTKLKVSPGSEWCVFAYVLNSEIVNKDGTVDDLYGAVFPLGSFSSEEVADKHAKKIIEKTGHPAVIVCRYSYPFKLTKDLRDGKVIDVPTDLKGKLIKFENDEYKKQVKEFDKRYKIEQDILRESQEEMNIDSIEYFKRQCYLAIKNKIKYEELIKQSNDSLQEYNKCKKNIKQHLVNYPKHEEEWLDHLKEKLNERGEEVLYKFIENNYNKYRDDILDV